VTGHSRRAGNNARRGGELGLNFFVIVAGSIALVSAPPLILVRLRRYPGPAAPRRPPRCLGLIAVLIPTIIRLTGFFAMLSLSDSGISKSNLGDRARRWRWRLRGLRMVMIIFVETGVFPPNRSP
jgi:hypothetical protein